MAIIIYDFFTDIILVYSLVTFTKYIFFDYFLPKTGTIVTDYPQTGDGRRFWRDRIGEALQLGKYVYYVSFQPDNIQGQSPLS